MAAMEPWQELMKRVEASHGIVTHTDLVAAGLSRREIDRWRQGRRLVPVHNGVYRIAGAPPSFESRVAAAVRDLGPDGMAWAAGCAASRMWMLGIDGPENRIEILRPEGLSAARAGVVVRRSTRILPHHVTVLRQIPITAPARTLFDLARSTGPVRLDRAISTAIHSRTIPCTLPALYRVLYDLGGRGRPGTRRMRLVLDEHHLDEPPTESVMDVVGRALLRDIPGIEFQVEMSDEQGYIRRLDGLIRHARLAVEFDSREFHDAPAQRRLDAEGDRRLRDAHGILTRRLDWGDITRRGDLIHAELLRAALAAAS